MNLSRRHFVITSTAAVAGTIVLPHAVRAAAHGADSFETDAGMFVVHPVEHASIVLETPKGVIYVDTVGDPSLYDDMPDPDLIVITHEHGDHYNADTLTAISSDSTPIIVNPAVYEMLPENLKSRATSVANGATTDWEGVTFDAIPAYNITEGREKFHPQGRDNGYVMTFDGFRIYVSGDTEDTAEMRALENIDMAFVCMNLPFTMDATAAADAVNTFQPKVVYPYHFRGRDGGTQDPRAFAEMVTDAEVKIGGWYPGGLG